MNAISYNSKRTDSPAVFLSDRMYGGKDASSCVLKALTGNCTLLPNDYFCPGSRDIRRRRGKGEMGLSSFLRKVTDRISGVDSVFNSAIIVAAGSGTRASTGGTTKQMMPLLGIPVIARTVSVFEECGFINEIIIVAKPDELPLYDGFIREYGWKKISAVVPGKETRQLSVIEGFRKISDSSQFVYIHDGARCLVTKETIKKVGHAACMKGAAYAAKKANETVRHEENGSQTTLDREKIWLAQTPQVFMTEMYRAAAYSALKNGISATDDVMLAEAAGFTAVPVDCGGQNIKITDPYDFAIAAAILNYRAEGRDGK